MWEHTSSCVLEVEGNWVSVNQSNVYCRRERGEVLRSEDRLQTRVETHSRHFGEQSQDFRVWECGWGALWESNECQPYPYPIEKWGMGVFWWHAERSSLFLTGLILRTALVCLCSVPPARRYCDLIQATLCGKVTEPTSEWEKKWGCCTHTPG